MSADSSKPKPQSYPSPTLVVGLGKVGLSVLEDLADDYRYLKDAFGDPSLGNLRLLHLRPPDKREALRSDERGEHSADWRAVEHGQKELASYLRPGDLATRIFNFSVLRSLGLIRYFNGIYEVACPRDAGIIDTEDKEETEKKEKSRGDEMASESSVRSAAGTVNQFGTPQQGFVTKVYRKRYFRWISLSPDPFVAADKLVSVQEMQSGLDLFVTPILNRVRDGQSPHVLLLCISRMRAYLEGRDPSPWSWLRGEDYWNSLRKSGEQENLAAVEFKASAAEIPLELYQTAQLGKLLPRVPGGVHSEENPETLGFSLNYPVGMIPKDQDLVSPFCFINRSGDSESTDSYGILGLDWESPSWMNPSQTRKGAAKYRPLPVSDVALGLYDHDETSTQGSEKYAALSQRLMRCGVELHQALVKLWVDLQRGIGGLENLDQENILDQVAANFDQSLEILGELIVRRAAEEAEDLDLKSFPELAELHNPYVDGRSLADTPSRMAQELEVGGGHRSVSPQNALEDRLDELGLGVGHREEGLQRRLFRQLVLGLEKRPDQEFGVFFDDEIPISKKGIQQLRAHVNNLAREFYSLEHLRAYRTDGNRLPPRLSVYIVAELGDPFTRATVRRVTREIHAELSRALGPIFDECRTGLDRSLSIVPILWMPHPADPFSGRFPELRRFEESNVIEAVHRLRRWCDSVPRGSRAVGQIFVNGRVTENSVLGTKDIVQQTRDFLSLSIRNSAGSDTWLTSLAVGAGDSNILSTFSCFEIDFPAARAREYLANRLARDVVETLRRGEGEAPKTEIVAFEVPELGDVEEESVKLLRDDMGKRAKTVETMADCPGLGLGMDRSELRQRYSEQSEEQIAGQIHDLWQEYYRSSGLMDDEINKLRRGIYEKWTETQKQLLKAGDQVVRNGSVVGGVRFISDSFARADATASEQLSQREKQKKDLESRCPATLPTTKGLASPRHGILSMVDLKPDWGPIQHGGVWFFSATGLVLSGLFGPVLLDSLAPQSTPIWIWTAAVLGLTAAGTLAARKLAVWWFERHVGKIVEQIRSAIESYKSTASKIVDDKTPDGGLSVRGFFQKRVVLTAGLSRRSFAFNFSKAVKRDRSLGQRIERSIEAVSRKLMREAEEIGVRPAFASDGEANTETEDNTHIFDSRSGRSTYSMLNPEHVTLMYKRGKGGTEHRLKMVNKVLDVTRGFEGWRKEAALADSEAILDVGRGAFEPVLEEPIRHYALEEDARKNVLDFTYRHFSNIGLGAQISSRVGLDPDGMEFLSEAWLLIPQQMNLIDCQTGGRGGRLEGGIEVHPVEIRSNTAYLTYVVQDLASHCIKNLVRFESYVDRPQTPDGRLFPVSQEAGHSSQTPLNRLSGTRELQLEVFDSVRSVKQALQEGPSKPKNEETE